MTGPDSALPTYVGRDAVVEGRIVIAGELVVAGQVRGAVTCTDARVATRVHVARGAVVEGDVQATVVAVEGRVTGHVLGTESVRLGPGAEVGGDVSYARLDMAMDARVDGRLVQIERSELSNVVPLKP